MGTSDGAAFHETNGISCLLCPISIFIGRENIPSGKDRQHCTLRMRWCSGLWPLV